MEFVASMNICSDPQTPGTYFTDSNGYKICRTTDYGETWTKNLGTEIPGIIGDIKISPVDGTIYAGGSGFWFSTDQGESWTERNDGFYNQGIQRIACRIENETEQVYAGTRYGLYKWAPIDETSPSIDLTAPNGGEILNGGDNFTISWNASDNDCILYADLFLSTDSGASWPLVVKGGVRTSGSYGWTVPMINSNACRIKSVAYDPSWNKTSDMSAADFTIHAPTLTPSAIPTYSPSPHPTESSIPTIPATVTPSPSPYSTPYAGEINVFSLIMPAHSFSPGDPCSLTASVENPGDPLTWVLVFIVLEIYGEYWTAPGWGHFPESFDYYTFGLPQGIITFPVINEFAWPENAGSASGLYFLAAVTDKDMNDVLSNIYAWRFGYHE